MEGMPVHSVSSQVEISSLDSAAPPPPGAAPEAAIDPVPGKCRIIWESIKFGMSRHEVAELYKTGEIQKFKDLANGMGFFETRKAAKVQVAIRTILQEAVPKEPGPPEDEVWRVAAELTRVVVTKKIQNLDTQENVALRRGQTYNVKKFGTPFSVHYNKNGTMLIKLKPGMARELGIKSLGEGSYGKVTRAIQIDARAVHKLAVKPVAYKREHRHNRLQLGDIDQNKEYRMNLRARGCKHVVKMHTARLYEGAVTDEKHGRLESVQKVGTVFEMCNGGDLSALLRNGGFSRLPEEEQLRLFREILIGVKGLHRRGIVHLDLKPGNIMLVQEDGKLHARIGDLGIAGLTSEMAVLSGTKGYWAPEVEQAYEQKEKIRPDPAMDCHSLGKIAFMLFGAEYDEEKGKLILRDKNEIPPAVSALFDMADKEPKERLTVNEAIKKVDERLRELRQPA